MLEKIYRSGLYELLKVFYNNKKEIILGNLQLKVIRLQII